MKIFIIHYKKLVNRKKDMIEQLNQFNITDYEFIEQYDRDTLIESDKKCFKKDYKTCQIAITLSHLFVYKEILEKHEMALILEDDAIFHPNFVDMFSNYIKQLPSDFDALFIGHGCNLHIEPYKITENCNVYKKQESRCTDSYLVSKQYAQKVLNYVNNMDYKIDDPVDIWLNRVFKDLNLNIYWGEPHIVVQGSIVRKYPSSHLYEGSIIF